MTSFIDDNGNELDYDGKDLASSKRTLSLINFKIRGDSSINFKLPNTANNRSILNVYGANQIGGGFMTDQLFYLVRDGNIQSKGKLVVQNYSEDEIECFFISGNSNWIDEFNFPIKQIELNEDSVLISEYTACKSNTKGIIFPIIDVAFNGEKISYNREPFLWPDTRPSNGLNYSSFLTENIPCYYFHSLITGIANHTGIKIEGDILNDLIFKSIVITPESLDIRWPENQISESYAYLRINGNSVLDPAADTAIPMNKIIKIGSLINYNTSTYEWTAPYKCMVEVTPELYFNNSDTYTVSVYKNGSSSISITMSISDNFFKRSLLVQKCEKGDILRLNVRDTGGGYTVTDRSKVEFKIRSEIFSLLRPNIFTGYIPLVCPQAIVPDVKAVDIIKSLCVMFNLLPVYDAESKILTLTKVKSITKESSQDWSNYYSSHTERYKNVAKFNYINYKSSEEPCIDEYNKTYDNKYGGAVVETDFNSTLKKEVISLPFGSVCDMANKTKSSWAMPYIPYFELEDDEEFVYTSVTGAIGGNATFVGTGWTSKQNVIYRISDDNNIYSGYTDGGNSPTTLTPYVLFRSNSTGSLFTQKISRNIPGSRLLFVKTDYDISNIGMTDIKYNTFSESTIPFAWFDKPKLDMPVDSIKYSLAMGEIIGHERNQTLNDLYWDKLENIYNSPEIVCKMYIPHSVYNSFNGGSFIFLKTERLTGYFLVDEIKNYTGSDSLVDVVLYKID